MIYMAIAKNHLYQLIDQLPDAAVRLAEKMLQAMVTEFPSSNENNDSKTKLMNLLNTAPFDDEPTTDEDWKAINDARANIIKGEGITIDEFKKELGL